MSQQPVTDCSILAKFRSKGFGGCARVLVLFFLTARLSSGFFHTHEVSPEASAIAQTVHCVSCDVDATLAVASEPIVLPAAAEFTFSQFFTPPCEVPTQAAIGVALLRGPPTDAAI